MQHGAKELSYPQMVGLGFNVHCFLNFLNMFIRSHTVSNFWMDVSELLCGLMLWGELHLGRKHIRMTLHFVFLSPWHHRCFKRSLWLSGNWMFSLWYALMFTSPLLWRILVTRMSHLKNKAYCKTCFTCLPPNKMINQLTGTESKEILL